MGHSGGKVRNLVWGNGDSGLNGVVGGLDKVERVGMGWGGLDGFGRSG